MISRRSAPLSASKPTDEEVTAQIAAILESPCLQNAESSRQLLIFLAGWSQEHPGQHVKEIEIAIALFHRTPGDFDAQTDSVVRVQMARLRKKICEYYLDEGVVDDVLIDIPKGSYSIVASYRVPGEIAEPSLPIVEIVATEKITEKMSGGGSLDPVRVTSFRKYVIAAILAGGIVLGVAGTLLLVRLTEKPVGPHLRQFWSQVLQKDAQSVVAFSNPRLAGTLAVNGLHYFQEGVDSQDPTAENYSYTGAGDVEAASALMHLFDSLHLDLKVRSSALLSWSQAKESNLIFIGRPEQNPALGQLPRLPEFYFKFSSGIVNAHPRPGEQEVYPCSKRPYSHDYAIIAFIPGLNRSLNTLILAGNTTYGSFAAAEYVSSESSVATLLGQLGVDAGGKVPYFEALLEVRINNDTPVWSKLVAQRTFAADRSSWKPPLQDER
jgi:hypothetical protein